MPRTPLVVFPVVLLLTGLPVSLAATAAHAQASAATSRFIAKAATTDAFERDAGRLAEQRSKNADVRAFAAMMVTAHTDTTNALRQVLAKDKLPMPGQTTPDPTQAKLLSDLKFATDEKFDQAYMHSQVVAHQTALALMQEYAARGDNPDLKMLAAKTEPVVQMHLDMAKKLEAQLGGPPKGVARKIG